jgi:EAL domain-containing protein (putative c-di-GMP-specific phosphodiesterase class I)
MKRAELLLQNLIELGSLIYIDDFGTGFSSLSLIQQLPISGLKIDKSFVIDMEANPKNAKLVNSIIMLAMTNGLGVTAEGVETVTELNMLKLHPNVKAQGYYISKPVESSKLGKFK